MLVQCRTLSASTWPASACLSFSSRPRSSAHRAASASRVRASSSRALFSSPSHACRSAIASRSLARASSVDPSADPSADLVCGRCTDTAAQAVATDGAEEAESAACELGDAAEARDCEAAAPADAEGTAPGAAPADTAVAAAVAAGGVACAELCAEAGVDDVEGGVGVEDEDEDEDTPGGVLDALNELESYRTLRSVYFLRQWYTSSMRASSVGDITCTSRRWACAEDVPTAGVEGVALVCGVTRAEGGVSACFCTRSLAGAES